MGYKEILLFQSLEIPDSFEEREGRFSSADQTESSKECFSDCTNKLIKNVWLAANICRLNFHVSIVWLSLS